MSTRLLASGDLHLGAGAAYADDRLADQDAILEQLVDVARDREVDGVLLAGDIFDRPKPTPAELHTFARFARRLEQSAIPTVAILGDVRHDQLAADLPSALELFGHGDWMRVSRHPEALKLAGVTVCTLPAAPTHRLIATQGGRDDVNELAVAFLLEAAAELRAQVDGPAVLLAHWAVTGASLPNGLPVSDLHKPMLPLDALEQLGFDAVVLGDIHNPSAFNDWNDTRGPVFYVGSPMCLNFGEENVSHGCWILDVPGDHCVAAPEFVRLNGRRFVTVDVDLTEPHIQPAQGIGEYTERDTIPAPRPIELLDETDAIAAELTARLPLTDAVIRIRYRGTEEQIRRVDVQALRGFCLEAGAHRVAQIVPDIVRVSRARAAGVDEQLAPQAALDAWIRENLNDDLTGQRLRTLFRDYSEQVAA